jgi:serine/threonine protein kinase
MRKTLAKDKQLEQRFKDGFVQMLGTHLVNSPYYVEYEYMPEGNLKEYMKNFREKHGRCFTPIEATEIILQLAEKMALPHTLPDFIVHRDLKPENILVYRSEPYPHPPQLKIGDFGIGKVSLAASAMDGEYLKDYAKDFNFCSRAYASYQQSQDPSRGVANDDVYALAVILNELITGEVPPRRGDSWRELLSKKGMTNDQINNLDEWLGGIEEKRPPNAAEMAERIRELFPPLREQVHEDFKHITQLKKEGNDWQSPCLYH